MRWTRKRVEDEVASARIDTTNLRFEILQLRREVASTLLELESFSHNIRREATTT